MNPPVYVLRHPDVAARRIAGELMLMVTRDSSLISVNEIAALLWEAADGQTPLTAIVERDICANFDVGSELAYADALEAVHLMAEAGVFLVSDAPIDGKP